MTDETKPGGEAPPVAEAAAPTPAPDAAAPAPVEAKPEKPTEAQRFDAFSKAIDEAAPKKEEPAAEAKDEKAVEEKPTDGKPTEAKPEDDEAKRAAKALDDEIKSLDLKGKSAERFRELSKRPTEEQVAPLRVAAAKLEEWHGIIEASTAKPPQLSAALGYIQAINSRDPKAMKLAYDEMAKEQAWLAQQLGIELPGTYDPLAEHADLKQQVDEGDMPRAAALEIARHRAESRSNAERDRRAREADEAQRNGKAAQDAAMQDIAALNARLKGSDPDFARKLPLLAPAINLIRRTVHPKDWAAEIEAAYRQIKVEKVATPPPVTTSPIRPTGSSAQQVRTPKNAFEAFDMAIDGATQR